MKTIYELQQIADRLRASTEVNSISPEDTFGLQADVLEYLADMEQNAEGLGIHQVYASYAAMLADASAPVGSNGKPLRFGQLVVIYDSSNTTQAESGNVYAWQKGQTGSSAWKLMGNLGNVHALQSQIDSLLSSDESMKGKLTELENEIGKKATFSTTSNKRFPFAFEVGKTYKVTNKSVSSFITFLTNTLPTGGTNKSYGSIKSGGTKEITIVEEASYLVLQVNSTEIDNIVEIIRKDSLNGRVEDIEKAIEDFDYSTTSDKITDPTTGESVKTQVDNLQNAIIGNEIEKSYTFTNEGKAIIRATGVITSTDVATECVTDFIPIDGVTSIKVRGRDNNAYAIVAFYREANASTWISSYYPDAAARGDIEVEISNIPNDAHFFVAHARIADTSKYVKTFKISGGLDDKQDKLTFDKMPTEGSSNPVESNGIFLSIADFIKNNKPIVFPKEGEDGYGKGIVRTNGSLVTESSLTSTPFIHLNGISKIKAHGRDAGNYSIMSFYDENFSYIAPLFSTAQNKNLDVEVTEFPEGAKYFRVQAQIADSNKSLILYTSSGIVFDLIDSNENVTESLNNILGAENGVHKEVSVSGRGTTTLGLAYVYGNFTKGSKVRLFLQSETGLTCPGDTAIFLIVQAHNIEKLYNLYSISSNSSPVDVGWNNTIEYTFVESCDYIRVGVACDVSESLKMQVDYNGELDRINVLENEVTSIVNNNKFIRIDNITNVMRPCVYNLGVKNASTYELLFDTLVAEHPDYVSKENLKDTSGIELPSYMDNYNMPMYRFKPSYAKDATNPNYDDNFVKVLLVGGTHGEHVGIYALYEFCKALCNDYASADDMMQMRIGMDLWVLPISNPSTFTDSPYGGRTNANGVDPNRNMPTRGWYKQGEGTSFYSGDSAGSEYESKVLVYLMDRVKPDIFIDSHNSESNSFGHQLWCDCSKLQPMSFTIGLQVCQRINPMIKALDTTNYPQDMTTGLAFTDAQEKEGQRMRYASERGVMAMTLEGYAVRSYTNGILDPSKETPDTKGKQSQEAMNNLLAINECGLEMVIKRMIQYVSMTNRKDKWIVE